MRTNAEPRASSDGHHKIAGRRKHRMTAVAPVIIILVAMVALAAAILVNHHQPPPTASARQKISYLGVVEPDSPDSYNGTIQVANAIGAQPDLAVYYSPWLEPFQLAFANSAKKHGATPLVQISPGDYSLTSIANGRYDSYLRSYAAEVKKFGGRVILSFAHEMNGNWYPWGRGHTSPAVFVRSWRHVVSLFREAGAANVTWMWTANIMGTSTPAPGPWWPGNKYVNWIGIDGYFWYKAADFDTVFGPTIASIREYTHAPILIAETGASPSVNQPAKIVDLFAGVENFGLLGFVYFDEDAISTDVAGEHLYWRLTGPSLALLRRDVKIYMKEEPRLSSIRESEHD